MALATFTLTKTQAAYVVAALRLSLDSCDGMEERDRMAMESIMHELSAPMNLSADVRKIVEDPSIKLKKS